MPYLTCMHMQDVRAIDKATAIAITMSSIPALWTIPIRVISRETVTRKASTVNATVTPTTESPDAWPEAAMLLRC